MKRIIFLLLFGIPLFAYSQSDCFEPRFNLSKSLFEQGKYEEAKEMFNECFECYDKPSDKDSQLNEYIRLCDEKLNTKLSVKYKNLDFDADPKGTEYVIKINSNKNWTYSHRSDWCVVRKENDSLYVHCLPNIQILPRECVINVKASSKSMIIKVKQAGAELNLQLSCDSLVFDSLQSTKSVYVSTNADYWYFDSVPDWCYVYRQQETLFVTCYKNDSVVNRYGRIVIAANKQKKYIDVTQKVGAGKIKTTKNNIIFDQNGGNEKLSVISNSPDFTYQIVGDDWITVNKMRDTIVVMCDANTLPVSRVNGIVVTVNKTETLITIEQKANTSVLDISECHVEFEPKGTFKIVSVTSDSEWDYYDVPDWCVAYKVGDSLKITSKPNNADSTRQGYVTIKNINKLMYVSVTQRPINGRVKHVKFESCPVGMPIFIDGVLYDRTPSKCQTDSVIHNVRIGRRQFDNIAFDKEKDVEYKPGSRYLMITASNSNYIGAMTGFIGTKKIGMFNHFQIGIPVDELLNKSTGKSSYIYSFGPTVELLNHFSLFAGLGPYLYSKDNIYNFNLAVEFGAMAYYRWMMLSFGYEMPKIIGNDAQNGCFILGLGLCFDRYCEKTYFGMMRHRVSDSRRWWSINYIYSIEAKGVMFGDLGKTDVRGYIKSLYIDKGKDVNKQLSITTGLVFTPISGFVDLCTGIGAGLIVNQGFDWKGMEAEVGFVVNIWRFPITIMFHEYMLGKDSQFTSVEFGLGFHFGEFGKKKQVQYYY